jgi:hypothetical protein
MDPTLLPKRHLNFNGLHGVISQKIELYITSVVRTSDHYGYMHLDYKILNFESCS